MGLWPTHRDESALLGLLATFDGVAINRRLSRRPQRSPGIPAKIDPTTVPQSVLFIKLELSVMALLRSSSFVDRPTV